MRRLLPLLAVLFAVLATPASSQSSSSERLAAARDLVVTMKMADQFKLMMPGMMQTIKTIMVQEHPEAGRVIDEIAPAMLEVIEPHMAAMIDAVVKVYAANFTAEELRGVIAFYNGPTGKKFLEKMPSMMQQTQAATQAMAPKMFQDLRSRMDDELRKRGYIKK